MHTSTLTKSKNMIAAGINTLSKIFTLLLLTIVSVNGYSLTVKTSQASGNWSSGSTWNTTGSGSPIVFIVNPGHTVTINTAITSIDSVKVYGTLSFGSLQSLTMNKTGEIEVFNNGAINSGSASSYIYFNGTLNQVFGPFSGSKIINGPVFATGNTSGFVPMSVALPVQWTNFTVSATINTSQVDIAWSTVTETNSDYFDIQRSTDGETWTSIGTAKGQGNSTDLHSYDFTDAQPVFGNSLYRFVEVDYNGNSHVSPVKSVTILKHIVKEINAYPNPANSQLDITIENTTFTDKGNTIVIVTNNMGQLFEAPVVETLGNIHINTEALPEGIYTFHLQSGNDIYNKTIIIRH